MRRIALVLALLVAAVAGGAIALGIGAAAGWVGSGETVVLEQEATSVEAGSTASGGAKPLPGNSFDPAEIYRARADGVVTIYAIFPGHGQGGDGAAAQGSGFVVDGDGTILTNSHVITTAGEVEVGTPVEPAEQVFVEFRDGDRARARIVGWDLFSDVGVIEVEPEGRRLAPVPLGDSDGVEVGEPVAAIGSPFGQESSLSVGVVSATGRSIDSLTSSYDVADAIQTDAPMNRGNSGGPLFDARGQVIGITAQIRSNSGTAEGVGFAIPIRTARRVLDQLRETGRVRYAWLGIKTQSLTPSLARELGLDVARGAAIQCVITGSPAQRAGLRGGSEAAWVDGLQFTAGGDVVVAIDGVEIGTTEDVSRVVATRLFPGNAVPFTVVRDGRSRTVTVTPGDRARDARGDC